MAEVQAGAAQAQYVLYIPEHLAQSLEIHSKTVHMTQGEVILAAIREYLQAHYSTVGILPL